MSAAALNLVAEHAAPVLEALVRRQHGRRPLMPGVDEREEEHCAVLIDRQATDLVDRQEGRMRQHAQAARQVAGGLGLGAGLDQPGQGPVIDAPGGFGCRDCQAYGQVGLPDPGRAKQDHVLAAVEEAALAPALDLLALDAGLEGEVERVEGVHCGQPGGAHGGLEPAVVARHDPGARQLLDGLGRRDRAAVGLGQDAVDGFQRAGPLQVGQHRPQSVAPARRRGLHCSASA